MAAQKDHKVVYIILDTGAQCSLITLKKANQLNLKINRTAKKAVQADGVTKLAVVGEISTTFTRGETTLDFEALVIGNMGVDIIGGTDFHINNDVSTRMANNTITIKGKKTVPASTAIELEMDRLESKPQLVAVSRKVNILPGETLPCIAPPGFPNNAIVSVEPYMQKRLTFLSPKLVEVKNGMINVENESSSVLKFKKGYQIMKVTNTVETPDNIENTRELISSFVPEIETKSTDDILKEIELDQTNKLSEKEKMPFVNIIREYTNVLQDDLPGYNGNYGKVNASYEFNSSTRPPPQKVRTPGYGILGEKLYNEKCAEMMKLGVLIDPLQLGIQPKLVNNSWVVKKGHAASKSWDQCCSKDVRVVTGFDYLNKYLKAIPSKVNKFQTIYTSITQWKYMGEMDFKDMYWQLKFDKFSSDIKDKLSYLCIRTSFGTMTYTRGAMGLLGMDSYQEELTDRLFGDMVVDNKLVKVADNIYFGSDDLESYQNLFREIMKRCSKADLRIKPSKIKLNIISSDILGLHWEEGKLSPSPHKLDPLANCEQPKTVKGLRSFLGGVRWNEICLPGGSLATVTSILDEQIGSNRPGTEEIIWTEKMVKSFSDIQTILKDPLQVSIPRKGDECYIANDACQVIPGMAVKLFIKRPGIERFLPSFNFGFRLKESQLKWQPCELEALSLSKGIEKLLPFLKSTENPTIALVDSKASYQASQHMASGKYSSNRRLQDLLSNLSSSRITIQLISAKLPSSLLTMIDFNSRNPITCSLDKCTICKELETPDITFFGKTFSHLPFFSKASWIDIQRSCPDLRRVHKYLKTGTTPTKKEKNIMDIRRYIRSCELGRDGMIVVKRPLPFQARPAYLIVIPRSYSITFTQTLHTHLDHPFPDPNGEAIPKIIFHA